VLVFNDMYILEHERTAQHGALHNIKHNYCNI
jgi:hypothetical protein